MIGPTRRISILSARGAMTVDSAHVGSKPPSTISAEYARTIPPSHTAALVGLIRPNAIGTRSSERLPKGGNDFGENRMGAHMRTATVVRAGGHERAERFRRGGERSLGTGPERITPIFASVLESRVQPGRRARAMLRSGK